MGKRRVFSVAIIFPLILLFGCAGMADIMTSPTVINQSQQTIAQKQFYNGPRIAIAVLNFPIKSGSTIKINGNLIDNYEIKENLSEGMQDMIVTALTQAGKFQVLEREVIEEVAREQKIEGKSAPNIKSARFLIKGAITGFEANQAGIGGSVGKDAWGGFIQGGISGAALGAVWGIAKKGVSAALSQDYIAVDARIISTETSEVVWTASLKATPKELSGGLGGIFGENLLGLSGTYKTPIAKAQRALAIMLVNAVAQQAFSDYQTSSK